MQKNQNFSCLFRHYAKHNGLKKEGCEFMFIFVILFVELSFYLDLIFSFVEELLPDQTPETVHLMPQGKKDCLQYIGN